MSETAVEVTEVSETVEVAVEVTEVSETVEVAVEGEIVKVSNEAVKVSASEGTGVARHSDFPSSVNSSSAVGSSRCTSATLLL